jgi:hypothetical protein
MQLSLKSIIQQFNDRLMTNKMTITN